jgi:hypothetical protein
MSAPTGRDGLRLRRAKTWTLKKGQVRQSRPINMVHKPSGQAPVRDGKYGVAKLGQMGPAPVTPGV